MADKQCSPCYFYESASEATQNFGSLKFAELSHPLMNILAAVVGLYILIKVFGLLVTAWQVDGTKLFKKLGIVVIISILFELTVFEEWLVQPIMDTIKGLASILAASDFKTGEHQDLIDLLKHVHGSINEPMHSLYDAYEALDYTISDLGSSIVDKIGVILLSGMAWIVVMLYTFLLIELEFVRQLFTGMAPLFLAFLIFDETKGWTFTALKIFLEVGLSVIISSALIGIIISFIRNGIEEFTPMIVDFSTGEDQLAVDLEKFGSWVWSDQYFSALTLMFGGAFMIGWCKKKAIQIIFSQASDGDSATGAPASKTIGAAKTAVTLGRLK